MELVRNAYFEDINFSNTRQKFAKIIMWLKWKKNKETSWRFCSSDSILWAQCSNLAIKLVGSRLYLLWFASFPTICLLLNKSIYIYSKNVAVYHAKKLKMKQNKMQIFKFFFFLLQSRHLVKTILILLSWFCFTRWFFPSQMIPYNWFLLFCTDESEVKEN